MPWLNLPEGVTLLPESPQQPMMSTPPNAMPPIVPQTSDGGLTPTPPLPEGATDLGGATPWLKQAEAAFLGVPQGTFQDFLQFDLRTMAAGELPDPRYPAPSTGVALAQSALGVMDARNQRLPTEAAQRVVQRREGCTDRAGPGTGSQPALVVRHATAADAAQIMRLLHRMHEENGLVPANWEKVAGIVIAGIAQRTIIVAQQGPRLIGTTGLEMQRWWYSDAGFLGARWFFVHPDHRRSSAAFRMLKMAKTIARRRGLTLAMGVISPKEPERKGNLFRRKGFRFVGEMFIHE